MDFGVRRTALDDWERRAPSRRPRAPPRAPSRSQMLDGQIERFFVCLRAEVAKAAKNRRWQQSINRNTRMSMTSQELRMVLYRKVMRARFLKREALLGEAGQPWETALPATSARRAPHARCSRAVKVAPKGKIAQRRNAVSSR